MRESTTVSVADLEAELREARLAITILRSQLRASEEARKEDHLALQALKSKLELDRQQLHVLRQSLSWKLTRPLRAIKRRLRAFIAR